jgi:hypothetical protein
MSTQERILYCHCAYAQVVPKAVKEEVLRRLSESGAAFDAVADLCEMSARRDPALKQLAEGGEAGLKIAACFPRAVKWLFSAADATLPEHGVEILNMRVETADKIALAILGEGFGVTPSEPAVSLPKPSNGEVGSESKELT